MALVGCIRPAAAQDAVRVGGLAYLDGYYQIASPDSAQDGAYGFTYRRLYLTADARLSDSFSSRIRFEASDASLNNRGTVPFVKDLSLRWTSTSGHRITGGITSPPAFDFAEDIWDYRSLEKTLLDLNKVLSSRDFGVRFDGPIPVGRDGLLRYGLMVANNNGVFPEDDEQKRLYAQVQARPTDAVRAAVGVSVANYVDERTGERTFFGVLGYMANTFQAGVEGYLLTTGYDGVDNDVNGAGVSAFGSIMFAPGASLVARIDRSTADRFDVDAPPVANTTFASTVSTFGLIALAYAPNDRVRLMPNLRWAMRDGDNESDLLGRVTAEFTF